MTTTPSETRTEGASGAVRGSISAVAGLRSVKEAAGSRRQWGLEAAELLPEGAVAPPAQAGPEDAEARPPAPAAGTSRRQPRGLQRGPVRGAGRLYPCERRGACSVHTLLRGWWSRCLLSHVSGETRPWAGYVEGSGEPVISSFCVAAS